ncbi:hypothetical protein GE191_24955 [Serratia fonticola]|uniref:hypothetical protein n=1 Tax=Serratia fonticola TaxID=47917 RepID=UPI0013773B1D|nr:hypothetical protein [Serratia fonticola]NBJ36906.1 hypothetical protein [Serratia fonticola]
MGMVNEAFRVVITFDITVNGQNSIYSQITDILGENGFEKETESGKDFPENIYTGLTVGKIEKRSDGSFSTPELQKVSSEICDNVIKLIANFFSQKRIKHKIFVHVSRAASSATKLL